MTGTYEHTIDAKGRLFIPAKLREELGVTFYLAMGVDACLAIYPQAGYKQGEWRDILWNWLPLGEKEEIPPPLRPFGKLEPEQVAAILERYH